MIVLGNGGLNPASGHSRAKSLGIIEIRESLQLHLGMTSNLSWCVLRKCCLGSWLRGNNQPEEVGANGKVCCQTHPDPDNSSHGARAAPRSVPPTSVPSVPYTAQLDSCFDRFCVLPLNTSTITTKPDLRCVGGPDTEIFPGQVSGVRDPYRLHVNEDQPAAYTTQSAPDVCPNQT